MSGDICGVATFEVYYEQCFRPTLSVDGVGKEHESEDVSQQCQANGIGAVAVFQKVEQDCVAHHGPH